MLGTLQGGEEERQPLNQRSVDNFRFLNRLACATMLRHSGDINKKVEFNEDLTSTSTRTVGCPHFGTSRIYILIFFKKNID
jgi:hypothetical protein